MHPLPEAGLAHLDLFVAARHAAAILWAVDMAQLNPVLTRGWTRR